jgi:hypothetical protein
MLAGNVHADLRQLSYGSVIVKSYGWYDVNGFTSVQPFFKLLTR